MRAAVVIPTYNERENVTEIIRQVLKMDPGLTVVIVDDDSPDGTGDLADQMVKQYPGMVKVIHRKGERGRASAGVAGFKRALEDGFDCVIEMDADGSHDPREIPNFLYLINEYDVVIGSRYVEGGRSVNCAPASILLSRVANAFNRLVLGLNVEDTSGGFKCYRRRVLEAIGLDDIVSWGYTIGPELLYKCMKKGFTMKEIPISFMNRMKGKSKASLRVVLEYPISVLRIRLRSK